MKNLMLLVVLLLLAGWALSLELRLREREAAEFQPPGAARAAGRPVRP